MARDKLHFKLYQRKWHTGRWLVDKHARTPRPVRAAFVGLRNQPCHRHCQQLCRVLTSAQPTRSLPASSCIGCQSTCATQLPRLLHLAPQEERLIKDHMGRKWCLGAIRRGEARRGKAYDIVVFARPDLLWLRPVKPWCAYDSAHVLFSCPVLGCDMFWASPRQHALSLLSQADMHRDCRKSCDHGSCCCSSGPPT